MQECRLVRRNDDKRGQSRSCESHAMNGPRKRSQQAPRTELTPSLVRSNSDHHATAYPGGREFGGDDRRQGVVPSDSDPEEESPYHEHSDDVRGMRLSRQGLPKGCDDDEHHLNAVCGPLYESDEFMEKS